LDLTLTLTILGIIATVLAPFVGYVYKTRREFRNFYSVIWKDSKKIQPKEVLGERPHEEYYFERSIDTQVSRSIERSRNFLIVGSPLSGKTRCVFRSFHQSKKRFDVLVPRAVNVSSFALPPSYRFWKKKIIFIDDMQYYIEKQDTFHLMFRTAKDKNIPIVSTCHSGKEFKKVRNKLVEQNIDIDTLFGENIFEMEKLASKDGEMIALKLGMKWDNVMFNGTIGSVFMRLNEMERRYDGCDNVEKTILRSLRMLYLGGISEDNNFRIEWLKKIAKRFELEGKDFEWTGWLKSLEDKEFVKIERRNKVWAEDAYLDFIVKPATESTVPDVIEDLIETFSDDNSVLTMLGERAYDSGLVDVQIADYMKLSTRCFGKIILDENLLPNDPAILKSMNYLGLSYFELSKAENTIANVSKAVEYFNSVLKLLNKETHPFEYAKTLSRCGVVYSTLVQSQDNVNNFDKAISALTESATLFKKINSEKDIAKTYNNLGGLYFHLSEIKDTNKNLSCAIESFKLSINLRNRMDSPKEYALIKNNLANCYAQLSLLENKSMNARSAINSYKDVLTFYSKEKFPLQFGIITNNLGNAYSILAEEENRSENSLNAIKYFEQSLEVRTADNAPVQYANTLDNLGRAYLVIAQEQERVLNCENAIECFKDALKIRTVDKAPYQFAATQLNLGTAYVMLAEKENMSENYMQGTKAFDEALEVFTEVHYPEMNKLVQEEIRKAKKIFFK